MGKFGFGQKDKKETFRSSGDTLTKEEFYRKLAEVREALFPSKKPEEVSSLGLSLKDPLHVELANRERGNRIGLTAVRNRGKVCKLGGAASSLASPASVTGVESKAPKPDTTYYAKSVMCVEY